MMARRGWSRLRIDQRGAAVIELALVLPMVIMFIFGLIEGARAIWTFQTLQETAFKAARCMVIGRTPCESTDDARNYAVAIAGQSNITVPLDGVTAEAAATCDGLGGQGRVQIVMPYEVVIGSFFNMDISNLTVTACMPVPPSS